MAQYLEMLELYYFILKYTTKACQSLTPFIRLLVYNLLPSSQGNPAARLHGDSQLGTHVQRVIASRRWRLIVCSLSVEPLNYQHQSETRNKMSVNYSLLD